MPRLRLACVAGALAVLAAAAGLAASADAGSRKAFTERGTVTRVVDGDTLVVRLVGGGSTRVRLLGVDTPERGACFSAKATARTRQLALGKRVVLKGDRTQDTRDRYGRLLAYAWLPGGKDLGFQLLNGGFAKVYVFRRNFERLSAYRRAESAAKGAVRGQWTACKAKAPAPPPPPTTPPPPSADCHPSYTPCLPVVGDLDCADVRALGKAPVQVLGSDPYRLDGDGDGWGCE